MFLIGETNLISYITVWGLRRKLLMKSFIIWQQNYRGNWSWWRNIYKFNVEKDLMNVDSVSHRPFFPGCFGRDECFDLDTVKILYQPERNISWEQRNGSSVGHRRCDVSWCLCLFPGSRWYSSWWCCWLLWHHPSAHRGLTLLTQVTTTRTRIWPAQWVHVIFLEPIWAYRKRFKSLYLICFRLFC